MSADISALIMPKLGLTMKEGKVAAWRAKPGDKVSEGSPVADIETEKITSEYDAPATGTLRRLIGNVGETLPIGALIGVLAGDGVSEADIDAFVSGFKPEQKR